MQNITTTDRLARFGYLARALVYGMIGYLAITSGTSADDGATGAFNFIDTVPAGDVVLAVLVPGLLAYGVYKFAIAAFDLDREGDDATGILKRAAIAVGGVAYLSMAYAAGRILMGYRANQGSETERAGEILALPFGGILLAIAGIGFVAAAASQARSAWSRSFMRKLEPDAPPYTCTIGRIGLAARTVVFAIVGWSLIKGAWSADQGEVRGLGDVLNYLRGSEVLYILVAGGLVVFAIYSAIQARYRIVPRVDVVGEAKRKASSAAA